MKSNLDDLQETQNKTSNIQVKYYLYNLKKYFIFIFFNMKTKKIDRLNNNSNLN